MYPLTFWCTHLFTDVPTYLVMYSLTYWCTHFLTPWNRDLPEKLTSLQLDEKCLAIHGYRNFITSEFATADKCVRDVSQEARYGRYHTIDSVCCSLQENEAIVIGKWCKTNYDDTVLFWQNLFSWIVGELIKEVCCDGMLTCNKSQQHKNSEVKCSTRKL